MLKALSRWGTIARNMAKKYIPLAEWAKLHGLPIQSVRDSASRWGLKKYTKKVAVFDGDNLIVQFNKEDGEFKVYPRQNHKEDFDAFLSALNLKKWSKEYGQ